jgi:hypothetical protein
MCGVREQHNNRGEIRRAQNWTGGLGPMDAAFVPPHPDEVLMLMRDLETFLHNEKIAVPCESAFNPDLYRVRWKTLISQAY